METTKDWTPEERGSNAPAGAISRVYEWIKENPGKAKTYAPHIDRDGHITIRKKLTTRDER